LEKGVDEKILEMLAEAEKIEAKKDITEGQIKIGERYYVFEETEFYDGKIKMYIPNNFQDMPEEARKVKYVSENRPEIIKSNEEGSTAITLNIIDSPLREDKVEELIKGMKNIIQKTNPANLFYDLGVVEVDSKNIGFFDFKNSAIDDFIYNIMFFFEIEGKTAMGTFSCRYSESPDWRDIAFQMINTIRVIKEEIR
jgi:hypothetical protein